ncbi:Crp/Fnr family transcriptional regulator [Fluviicola sp.]|uniref:Crp/Fnr family transcriptional regulator n=1 Tax=Fluviicola sp. TaxID=1917219 RepID=UPI0031DC7FAF
MEYASFLRSHIGSVIPITEEELALIVPYFTPVFVPKKSSLLTCDQLVSTEYLVLQGCMKLYMIDEAAKEYIIQFAMENWWISDYPAYHSKTKSTTCIQALEDCWVLELTAENKQALIEKIPQMLVFFGQKSFGGFVALQKRVLSLLKNSAKEKYELLLSQYPELFQRVPKTLIAHYLGVSRETLSRLEKKKE